MSTTARRDGRTNTQLRPLNFSYDDLARVDGSARFSFGDDSAALASISGPIEVRLAAELPSKATFEVLVRPLANIPATEAKLAGASLKSALEPALILTHNPRTLVQLVVQALSTPRSPTWRDALAAAMVNASTLALLRAGSVPMRGVVVAVAVGRRPDGSLVLDPSEEEAETLSAGGAFAFMFADELGTQTSRADCVWSSWRVTSGGAPAEELFQARELAKQGATVVFDAIRRNVETLGGATELRKPVVPKEEEHESESDDEKMEI